MDNIEHNEIIATAYSIHPGLLLKAEVLPNRKITGVQLADAIGAARPGITNVLNGKRAITAALALKIEAAIDFPASMLMKLQAAHDLAEAKRDMSALVEKIAEMSRIKFAHTMVANDHVESEERQRA